MGKDLETSECMSLLSDNCIGHLGYIAGKSPFIVPVTYFYDLENKSIISYSAPGHKIQSMRMYGQVSLQVDEIATMLQWRSVLINGSFEELKGSTAKKCLRTFTNGVKEIILRTKGQKTESIREFSSKMEKEASPIVYRIHISDIVGKYRNQKI
ncbi:pyridoxamine 5'-phosphate oxidase family protein [Zobellia uliginosa]|uniref:pyridoxamine 5'-phosphate oxidase family protein n=1 Tax=Zobellia uliginosa TaxID=143224 RepID=UPI001C0718AC|nr:pyridoxamine 5'-phosphate oxidase family protein [Zobellia uliginosa]MBU2947763.1 pyridoxamine 5'-phosphate oxidase family protein [Zobellia uliginosa]